MEIVPLLRKSGVNVEQQLAAFREQAGTFPRRHQELAAICYYLHFALWECQNRWYGRHKGITNFATLLAEIERWRSALNQTVCLVTFNYDTILEQAMWQVLGIEFNDVAQYIRHPNYILIKLHGSVNWGREVDRILIETPGNFAPIPVHTFSQQRIIDEITTLQISSRFRVVTSRPMLREQERLVFPAVAIPLAKKDEFVCPEEHVFALDEALPKVNKILTVGWRATEAEFLNKLRLRLAEGPDLMVVSGDDAGVEETLQNLAISRGVHTAITNGFTGMINRLGELEAFLV